jgi:hypothetical protein
VFDVRRHAAVSCDIVIVLSLAAMGVLLFTGGGVATIAGVRVSLTTPRNPALFCSVAGVIRCLWLGDVPFIGTWAWSPREIDCWPAGLEPLGSALLRKRAAWILVSVLAVSVLLRTINAVAHPGFSTGDDVEIHIMTLGALLHHPWPSWNLRNAFYPMTFI